MFTINTYTKLQNFLDDLKETLYPLEAPQRTRTVPLQVLAVGPSRCGTDSLRSALLQLGYGHTYHGYDVALNPPDDKGWWTLYKKKYRGVAAKTSSTKDKEMKSTDCASPRLTAADFDTMIGHCAAITDFDAAMFASDLIYAYPEAKAILNIRRDKEAWYRSTQNNVLPFKSSWHIWIRSFFCTELFWVQENLWRCLWPSFYRGEFTHTGKWVLDEHCALVRGSVTRAENLLEWSPEDGWELLCKFLGKPVPDVPFPNGNDGQAYVEKIGKLYRSFYAKADRNMAIFASSTVLAGLFLRALTSWTVIVSAAH